MKNRLNESQGVVENGMAEFADYLYKRCINNKKKPNRYGEVIFTIPSLQWNKYNKYKLANDSIQIIISNCKDCYASFSKTSNRQPIIEISYDLIYSGYSKFISVLMHELTHAVNGMSNLKDGESIFNRNRGKISRYGATPQSTQGRIGYLFENTEMNARITEAYYYLNSQKNDWAYDYSQYGNQLVSMIFDRIEPITKYNKMVEYVKIVWNDFAENEYGRKYYGGYDQYLKDLKNNNSYESSITSKLRFGNNKPNENDTYSQYLKRKFDIVFYMQKQCENFKKRIYKMIYKFITDIKEQPN